MSIGLGTALALWVISGAAFWGVFVAVGFGFRPVDEHDAASAPSRDAPPPRRFDSGATPEHVLARSRR